MVSSIASFRILKRLVNFNSLHGIHRKECCSLIKANKLSLGSVRACRIHSKASEIADTNADVENEMSSEALDKQTVISFPFEKSSFESREMTNLMIAVKNRKKRYQSGLVMLEGRRLIQDALDANMVPVKIFFSRTRNIENVKIPEERWQINGKPVFCKIPYKAIQMWSDLTTSPGLVGVFRLPDLKNNVISKDALPLSIICDNIREPGNLGAVLRVASALPCSNVLLTTGCVDLWDTKVTRASCGAHFKLAIENNLTWDELFGRTEMGKVVLADHRTSSEMSGENYENDDVDEQDKRNTCSKETDIRTMFEMPIMPYYEVDYSHDMCPITVIIGGETEGLSLESFVYADKRGGVRVNIPLSNGVDSLNSGTALGIIIFEIRRQLLLAKSGT